ncbi:hypothetical protein G6M24_11005 [Agrobacterium tumefaciens]|nr:hypothetical protein [Agrobacterium tumefaciens]
MNRPKTKDVKFVDNFNPLEAWSGFQEGNATPHYFFRWEIKRCLGNPHAKIKGAIYHLV